MVPNRQPELYAAALIPYTAAAVALTLRLVARQKSRLSLVWEDYLAIVAFVRIRTIQFDQALMVLQLVGSGFTFLSLYSMWV